ncbi:unnamed protein product [Protopolystoma xenopodis]|uniref:CAP N-terminal domain-containing protein n=1 Tax=Protopolystoma xenopodis TaxID=117903 RepID=A0A448WNU3_9PLAT|nr:unnamed protein product [Protopolystoma xenopodis]
MLLPREFFSTSRKKYKGSSVQRIYSLTPSFDDVAASAKITENNSCTKNSGLDGSVRETVSISTASHFVNCNGETVSVTTTGCGLFTNAEESILVNEAYEHLKSIITMSQTYSTPSVDHMIKLVQPLSHKLTEISNSPVSYVNDILISTQAYSNRVVQANRQSRPKHVEWVRSWLVFLAAIANFVQTFCPNGLSWQSETSHSPPPVPQVTQLLPSQFARPSLSTLRQEQVSLCA